MDLQLAFGYQAESGVYSPAATTALINTSGRIASNRPYPRIATPFSTSCTLYRECASWRLVKVRESTWWTTSIQAPLLYGMYRVGSSYAGAMDRSPICIPNCGVVPARLQADLQ